MKEDKINFTGNVNGHNVNKIKIFSFTFYLLCIDAEGFALYKYKHNFIMKTLCLENISTASESFHKGFT